MNSFSPITRQVVALGLPILALLLLIQFAVAPLISALADLREQLVVSREREARLTATLASPMPRPSHLPPKALFHATNRAAAAHDLQAALVAAAQATGFKLIHVIKGHTSGQLMKASADLTGVGPEGALLSFMTQVERGTPVIRFRRWQIRVAGDGNQQLIFDAEAIAAWTN